jgi:hypothetical protein
MKYLIGVLIMTFMLFSCGDDKMQEAIQNHKEKKQKVKKRDTLNIEIEKDSVLDTLEIEIKKDTIISVEKQNRHSIKYKEGIEVTIFSIIKSQKLSTKLQNVLTETLMDNASIAQEIDISIDEYIKMKVGELEKMGIRVTIDPNSPVNLSHKFVHKVIKGKDTIICKTKKK